MPPPGVSARWDDPEREPNRLREPGPKTRAHLTVLDGRSALDDMDLASRSATPRPVRAAGAARAQSPRAAGAPGPRTSRVAGPARAPRAASPQRAAGAPSAPGAPGPASAPRPAGVPRPLGSARSFDDEPLTGGVPGRRTITITGRGAERYGSSTYARRRSQRPLHERPGFQPDRFAMWAVLLCILLLLVAATSSHAAMLSPHAGAHAVLVAHAHIIR